MHWLPHMCVAMFNSASLLKGSLALRTINEDPLLCTAQFEA
jgi:hypothetical protein